jgi:hypothetical protein
MKAIGTIEAIEADEVFRIPKMTILPAPGSFAKVSGPYEGCWYNCREEFHWVNEKTRRFLYSHRLGTHTRIVDFIEKIEKKLGLKAKERTRFRRTQYGRVSLVVMSSWWRFSIRRSLFTALLRAGHWFESRSRDGARSDTRWPRRKVSIVNSSTVAGIARSKHSYFATVHTDVGEWRLNDSGNSGLLPLLRATIATVHGGN